MYMPLHRLLAMRRITTLGLLMLLFACTTPPLRNNTGLNTPDAFALSGRFTVNYQKPDGSDDTVSGSFDWQQQGKDARIDLRSPFGQTLAQIIIGAQAQLQLPDRAPILATDGESLTQQQLGWTLPVNGLRYWLLGQPNPNSTPQILISEEHISRASRVIQDGWQIDYLSWRNNQPRRISLRWLTDNPRLELRLVLDTWE